MMGEMSQAAIDVLDERERQMVREGYTSSHDDHHVAGTLSRAAFCYALCASEGLAVIASSTREERDAFEDYSTAGAPYPLWPWATHYWKPKSPRRDLVRAAALLLAEIERIDRTGEGAD